VTPPAAPLAVLAACAAATLAVRPPPTRRLAPRAVPPRAARRPAAQRPHPTARDRNPPALAQPLAAALAALAAYVLAGPRAGPIAALAVAYATTRLFAALPTRAAAERDRARAAAVPLVADLVAACVAAGASVDAALDAAVAAARDPATVHGPTAARDPAAAHSPAAPHGPANALADDPLADDLDADDPLADDLRAAVRATRLGVPPRVAWAPLLVPGNPPPVRALARAVVRSTDTGSAPAAILRTVADDARAAARSAADVAARRAGVVAVLPLGLCFLPAFVLLGVVPLVVSLVGAVGI
jgi:Flp pilus assembly protein TadB